MKLSQIGSGIVPDVLPKATWEPGEEMGRCQIQPGGYRTGLFYSVWLQLCIKHKVSTCSRIDICLIDVYSKLNTDE